MCTHLKTHHTGNWRFNAAVFKHKVHNHTLKIKNFTLYLPCRSSEVPQAYSRNGDWLSGKRNKVTV